MARRKLSLATIRKVATALPGVEEGTSYGTPALKLGMKLLLRLHQDGKSLVLKVGGATRDHLLQADPDTFLITDHYRGYPHVQTHLDRLSADDLRKLFDRAIAFSRQLDSQDSHALRIAPMPMPQRFSPLFPDSHHISTPRSRHSPDRGDHALAQAALARRRRRRQPWDGIEVHLEYTIHLPLIKSPEKR